MDSETQAKFVELHEQMLIAIYAGHRYQLAMETAIHSYETTEGPLSDHGGEVTTPGDSDVNDRMIDSYYETWKAATKRVVALREELELH